ncbi:unnamed protein product [Sympodiomycopsis kandeliae]
MGEQNVYCCQRASSGKWYHGIPHHDDDLPHSSALQRAWDHHRLPTSTARETCYLPLNDTSHSLSAASVTFSIRNHDPHYNSNYTNEGATHTTGSLWPANNNSNNSNGNTTANVPRPAYPRDSIDAEMDASKTSLQLAIEYGCSLDMIDWLLDMGHESYALI